MSTAETLFAGKIQKATFDSREGSPKFFRNSELPGKIIRECESLPARSVKNEVNAMQGLVSVFEDEYGIETVRPKYVIGPGRTSSEARAYAICDEIPNGITADLAIEQGSYVAPLDDLNSKFIQHTKDIASEGGVYNTELMHLHQYVMKGDTPVLVDVEPHFSRIMAPPEVRLDRDRDMIAIIDMLEGVVHNAIQLSRIVGKRTESSLEAEVFLNELQLSEGPIRKARAVLRLALRENSDAMLKEFFDNESDDEWQEFQHSTATRMFVDQL